MRTVCYIIWILIAGILVGHSQNKGYRIEGKKVIFTFDSRDYHIFTQDNDGNKRKAGELSIENVTVSGEFNNWLLEGWEMKQVSPYTYELAKALTDFDSRVNWEFKYVINHAYWAEPDTTFPNISESRKGNFWLDVYNLNLYTLIPDENGNTSFFLPGHQKAREVILSGSFNKWNETSLRLNKVTSGWKITLDLPPGVHTYKFIVDGEWLCDPGNPRKTLNEFGGYNSVIRITAPTTFRLESYADAKQVYLSGTFNNWNTKDMPMKCVKGVWEITADLPGGKHHYKFIVDGKWITDPENEIVEYDKYGHLNSVIMIE